MKHLNIESLSADTIESIKKDRHSRSVDELIFKYNLSARSISMICQGIKRQRPGRKSAQLEIEKQK
jgi:hypothetical protein